MTGPLCVWRLADRTNAERTRWLCQPVTRAEPDHPLRPEIEEDGVSDVREVRESLLQIIAPGTALALLAVARRLHEKGLYGPAGVHEVRRVVRPCRAEEGKRAEARADL